MSKSKAPPPIHPILSDFERLLGEEVGVALPAPGESLSVVSESQLAIACDEIPFRRVGDWLQVLGVESLKARSHWPWIARAACYYRYVRKQYASDAGNSDLDMKPSEIRECLTRIERHANGLAEELCRLQAVGLLPRDPRQRWMREHQQGLFQFVAQAAAGIARRDLADDHLAVLAGYNSFVRSLAYVTVAAKEASERMEDNHLARKAGAQDKGLVGLVRDLKPLWKNMTGRKPSVNKIHRRSGEECPDFVIFVQKTAMLVAEDEPSFPSIVRAFNTLKAA